MGTNTNTKLPKIQDIRSLLEHCCLCLTKLLPAQGCGMATTKFIDMSLLDMYTEVTMLPELKGDYPYRVCTPCCLKLANCHKFIKVCSESHKFFSESLDTIPQNKEEASLNAENKTVVTIIKEIRSMPPVDSNVEIIDCNNSTETKTGISEDIKLEIEEQKVSHLIANQSTNQDEDIIPNKHKHKKRKVTINPQKDVSDKPNNDQVDTNEAESVSTLSNNAIITINDQQYMMNELIIPTLSQCNSCDYKSFYKEVFKAHMFSKHPLKKVICLVCDKDFITKWCYINHRCNVSSRGYSEYKTSSLLGCNKCGQKFGNTIELFDHLNDHDNDTEFVCGLCRRDFAREDFLNFHLEQEHSFDVVV